MIMYCTTELQDHDGEVHSPYEAATFRRLLHITDLPDKTKSDLELLDARILAISTAVLITPSETEIIVRSLELLTNQLHKTRGKIKEASETVNLVVGFAPFTVRIQPETDTSTSCVLYKQRAELMVEHVSS